MTDQPSAATAGARTTLLDPGPGQAAARAALLLARSAEADAAAAIDDRDACLGALDTAVFGYSLLLGPLLVRDPGPVQYEIDGTLVTVDVNPPDSQLSATVILESILTAWCAGDFAAAERFGSVPTQRFKSKLDDRDRTRLMTVFAVASIARGNGPAFQRAEANALEADAAGHTLDATVSRGGMIPLLNALSAIHAGKRKAAERALVRLTRFHGWNTRETPHLAGLDRWSTAVLRWSQHCGIPLAATSRAIPSWLVSVPA